MLKRDLNALVLCVLKSSATYMYCLCYDYSGK
jgi:hypothetical protein